MFLFPFEVRLVINYFSKEAHLSNILSIIDLFPAIFNLLHRKNIDFLETGYPASPVEVEFEIYTSILLGQIGYFEQIHRLFF